MRRIPWGLRVGLACVLVQILQAFGFGQRPPCAPCGLGLHRLQAFKDIPQPDCAVPASSDEQFTIRAEVDAGDPLGVSFQAGNKFSIPCPQACAAVIAGGSK